MRVTLKNVLNEKNFKKMIDLGTRWSDGVDADNEPGLALYRSLGFN